MGTRTSLYSRTSKLPVREIWTAFMVLGRVGAEDMVRDVGERCDWMEVRRWREGWDEMDVVVGRVRERTLRARWDIQL